MRTLLIVLIAGCVVAVLAHAAHAENIDLSGVITLSKEGLECVFVDVPQQIYEIEVRHEIHAGVTGARFRLVPGNGVDVTYISETIHFPSYVGNTQDGLFVCYENCQADQVLIATVTYMGTGLTPGCGHVVAAAVEGAPGPEGIDCDGVTRVAGTQKAIFANPAVSPDCGCGFVPSPNTVVQPGLDCMVLPVEKTTWGMIKASYRE